MITREFWRWHMLSETTGRRAATRYRMTREQALAQDPTAEPVEGSLEVRQCPETPEEYLAISPGGAARGPVRSA